MHLVIIGNGVAGVTCALNARRRDPDAQITIIGDETEWFYSRTALMYAFMDRLPRRALEPFERGMWKQQRLNLVHDRVVDLNAERREVRLASGRVLIYDRLVLAVGATPVPAPWPGSDTVRSGLVNFVSMQDLDACESAVRGAPRAIVVGGGLIGIELVECLVHHRVPTTFIVRDRWYWPVALCRAEAGLVRECMIRHGVDVRLGESVAQVHASPEGAFQGVTLTGGERLSAPLLGVTIGVRPAVAQFAKFAHSPAMGRGIRVNAHFETSLPDVYAIGDCAEIQQADGTVLHETIWYSAKRQGALLGARNLWGDRVPYVPPVFFNSSKLFDLEYTTVGQVTGLPDSTPTVILRHTRRPMLVRVVHDGEQVRGFNMLGSRWNHEVLVRWIEERRSATYVLAHLLEAQFDVEFGRAPLQQLERQDSTLAEANA
jgi:NADPH-dependent 2,4-dienoyl-CoA reductase/sulfur reductase-like enzyme